MSLLKNVRRGRLRLTIVIASLFIASVSPRGAAQESIHSERAKYYDLLALYGYLERPTLNYTSLSDSLWEDYDAGPWGERKRSGMDVGNVHLKAYGPEIYSSYNSAYPHGMNDGALWQGVGLNSSLSAGLGIGAYGFSGVFKPQIVWEQNADFDIMPSAYPDSDGYGYIWSIGIDTPQRFGDESIFGYDWGESEVRYTYKTATVGFGTQPVWLGPGRQNAIILSNNAPTFPKVDFGLRKTKTFLGYLETRAFWGGLTESDYFDDDSSNDGTLLTGFTFSWSPFFMPYLTVGMHRTMLTKWDDADWKSIFTLVYPLMDTSAGRDQSDQRGSVTADFFFPQVGFEVYMEWAKNDYSTNLDTTMQYPFHAQAYTVGLRKTIPIGPTGEWLGELLIEFTSTESSRDYEFLFPYTFYAHHLVTQGYTNRGQVLGAGIGTGGNSQYFGFSVYQELGRLTAYAMRWSRDIDYLFFRHFGGTAQEKFEDMSNFNTELTFGLDAFWFATKTVNIGMGLAYCLNMNPLYDSETKSRSSKLNNFFTSLTVSFDL